MTDPTPNLEPPIPLAICGRCGAKPDKTDDWYECTDCERMVCYPCQGGPAHGPNPYDADLCTDCAEGREPQEGEADEAFLYERGELLKFLNEPDNYTRWCECAAALAPLVKQVALADPDVLSDNDRRAIEDAIRHLRVTERPWRVKEGAKA